MTSSYNNGIVSIFYDYPVANTKAEIVLPAPGSDYCWVIEDILYGFDVAPAAAKTLTIKFGAVSAIVHPVTAFDGKRYNPVGGLRGKSNEAVTITLAADSGGAIGYISAQVKKGHAPA